MRILCGSNQPSAGSAPSCSAHACKGIAVWSMPEDKCGPNCNVSRAGDFLVAVWRGTLPNLCARTFAVKDAAEAGNLMEVLGSLKDSSDSSLSDSDSPDRSSRMKGMTLCVSGPVILRSSAELRCRIKLFTCTHPWMAFLTSFAAMETSCGPASTMSVGLSAIADSRVEGKSISMVICAAAMISHRLSGRWQLCLDTALNECTGICSARDLWPNRSQAPKRTSAGSRYLECIGMGIAKHSERTPTRCFSGNLRRRSTSAGAQEPEHTTEDSVLMMLTRCPYIF
mmetsp:Transcript_22116/g.58576  ORF Transcript_22116/g.58576 Transcript_22116/m.58576 type:complete len:283 (-) Transcript_22116:619-1467(-)